jgi:hypothetical protein
MKTVNRSKRIEMWHPLKVASPCHGPGATAVRAEILRRFRLPWMGRNLSRRNLPGLGFAVPLSGLPGLSASLCGNTRRPSAKHFARRGFLRAPPLPPGHNPSGSHENSRKCQTLIVTPAEPGVYLRAIKVAIGNWQWAMGTGNQEPEKNADAGSPPPVRAKGLAKIYK